MIEDALKFYKSIYNDVIYEFYYRSIFMVRNIIRFEELNQILQDVAHAPDSSQDIPTSWLEPGPAAALGNQFSEAL